MTTQSAFSAAVLDPALPVPEGILRPDGETADKRFNVYRNNVISSLIDALGAGYPLVKKRVGLDFFNAMARIYVRQYPPKSPLMILYGAGFPAFLTEFEPAAKVPWLPDLAHLEWARRDAYHAADAEPSGLAVLANLGAEEMMFARATLLPSTRIVRSKFPILSIWETLNQGLEIPTLDTPSDTLIARPDMVVEMHPLPTGAAEFLYLLQRGSTLGAAIEAVSDAPNFDLSRIIGSLFEARLLASVELEDTP